MEQALRVVVLGISVLLLSWLLLAFMAKRLPPGTAKKRILTRLIGARHSERSPWFRPSRTRPPGPRPS